MLRRSRVFVPLLVVVSVLLGTVAEGRLLLVLAVAVALGVVADRLLAAAAERRLRQLTDRVVAFAGDVDRPLELEGRGGREWQRLVAALGEVATVLRERFQALRRERERVEQVLDAMPAAVLLFSGGVLDYANPAAREAFQLDEIAGDVALTPLRVLAVGALAQAVEEVGETGQDLTVSVRRGGRELAANASRVSADEIAVIVTDLTDLNRLHAMRRDFVANASHELKTPVTGLQALADSVQMAFDRDPDRARSMVDRMQAEANRLSRLVRDLLDLARLEEDVGERSRQRVDVAVLAQVTVERLAEVAQARGVTLEVEAAGPATVVGIVEDLKLILGNLVLNAVQYNRPGGRVRLHVSRQRGEVEVRVIDTGIGIPAADQERIFERFYRVDKARSRAAGGTGLGLSLVRHAVERHQGRIRVDSVLGEGSTFILHLPVDGGIGAS